MKAQQALRPDSDIQGEPGSPNIPSVIFNKIEASAIFVGDVTIAQNWYAGRRGPNPNVLIELGYAVHCLGWERIILVMNSHYGAAKHLPFHLQQHSFPFSFESAPANPDRATPRKGLADQFAARIGEVLAYDHLQAERMLQKLDFRCAMFLAAAKEQAVPYFNDDKDKFSPEIQRLLEVGIVYLNLGKDKTYAYEWTYLGGLARDECHKRTLTAKPAAPAKVDLVPEAAPDVAAGK